MSDTQHCYLERSSEILTMRNLFITTLSISSIGIIFSYYCIHAISFSKNTQTRFFKFIKIDSIICLIDNLNTLICSVIFLRFVDRVYRPSGTSVSFYDENVFNTYFTYVYTVLRAPLHTYSSCVDIILVYEKIQFYTKDKNFITKRSAYSLSLLLALYSIVLNISPYVSRDIQVIRLQTVTNETLELKSYKVRSFENYQTIFLVSLFLSGFIRDVGHLFVLIGISIRLIVVINKYNNRLSTVISKKKQKLMKNNFMNDCKNVLFKSTFSCLYNFINYYYNIDHLYGTSYLMNMSIYYILGILGCIRSSMNFLIMLKYNTIFRTNFLSHFTKK